MKGWLFVAVCALPAAACIDHSHSIAPGMRADVIGGDDHIFDLSSVVTVDPSLKNQDGSAPPPNGGNPPGPAKNVGPNLVENQDLTYFPQNETPMALDPNNPNHLLSGSNDYRHDLAACGIYASSDGGATWNDVGEGTTVPPGCDGIWTGRYWLPRMSWLHAGHKFDLHHRALRNQDNRSEDAPARGHSDRDSIGWHRPASRLFQR